MSILRVDRSIKLNSKLTGVDLKIWRGPTNGRGIEGTEEQDIHSLVLKEVDFSRVVFDTCLKGRAWFRKNETAISGAVKLCRLKERGLICLDALIAQALLEEDSYKTLEWLRSARGITRFDFMGTLFCSIYGGGCYYVCLHFGIHEREWLGYKDRWNLSAEPLAYYQDRPSAALQPS